MRSAIILSSAVALALLGGLSACKREAASGAPPRATDRIRIDAVPSTLTVPVQADLGNLAAALDREIPQRLWAIDKPGQTCVASKRIDIGIAKLKTPTLKCRVVGEVTRGKLRFEGAGEEIRLTMPIHAVVRAEDIGGLLKRETAVADAMAHATVKITLAQDWSPRGTIDIRYDWVNTPQIEFLGQRIDLTEQADAKLAPVIARLEKTLPGELGKLQVRRLVEQAWRTGFTTLELNKRNPPVWMRVTPQALQYGGYEVRGHALLLRLGLKALTETRVGKRPVDPAPTPLPPLQPLASEPGRLSFFIPVVADYEQLEPVLMKALVKRSARPFDVPGIGPVMAKFRSATIYGTDNHRIAVGLDFTAHDPAGRVSDAKGKVWLTARPVTAPDSRKVDFAELQVAGTTDMTGGDLLLRLANTPGLSDTLAGALGQNFQKDYDKLLGKIARAIDEKREGALVIHAQVTEAHTGRIRAAGEGLYLPVRATGTASIKLAR